MELSEFEEEEENKEPIDVDDDDCEEDDEEDYNLCSRCDQDPFAHLVQPCGHMICTNCVKKINVIYVDVEYPIL